MNNLQHIPQPSLAGHPRFDHKVSVKAINAAIAMRDRNRTEADWVWCPDNVQRRRDQLLWITVFQP